MTWKNTLYYGDNLDILRERIAPESVDLIYLDPPFNSNRSYNVLFGQKHVAEDRAQIEAFDDTWTWTQETERLYFDLVSGGAPNKVADALQAMRGLVNEGDVLAYLVMMAARLVALHGVLKPTGSLYLHCDPTASHYLKMLLDAVFGPENFKNEIVWRRHHSGHGDAKGRFGRIHDTILFYGKTAGVYFATPYAQYTEKEIEEKFPNVDEDGRRWYSQTATSPNPDRPNLTYEWNGHVRAWKYLPAEMQRLHDAGALHYSKSGFPRRKQYADISKGKAPQDLWTDVMSLTTNTAERLGYPTQKPLALLRRIIESSCPTDGIVLDPFCGCGTTIIAAQELSRNWIGIDVTYIAVDLMRRRLEDAFPGAVAFEMAGIPRDLDGAQALFLRSPFEFERWAVSLVYGQPNEKQVGDRGSDGVIRFPLPAKTSVGRVVVSVKGGGQVGPAMVRDLDGTINAEKADMGVLILMTKPTAKMTEAAHHTGSYTWPVDGRDYPKVQIVTIAQLLDGHRLTMPPPLSPYTQAARHTPEMDQLQLG